MCIKKAIVKNEVGLHARPATYFIQRANDFKSSIHVIVDGDKRVNAKSLLGVLSLGIIAGTEITIEATGDDEEAAADALTSLINSGFEE